MSWRDRLLPASFRGVPFEVEDHTGPTGRRLVVDAAPERNPLLIQDLGRREGRFRFSAYVHGDDYINKRDALLAACEREGHGELVHPSYGRLWGSMSDESSWTESAMDGGMCRFSLSFVEAAEIEVTLTGGLETATTTGTVAAAGAAAQTAATAASAAADAEVATLPSGLRRLYSTAQTDSAAALSLVLGATVGVADDIESIVYETLTTYDAAVAFASSTLSDIAGAPARVAAALSAWLRRWTSPAVRQACDLAVATTYATADAAERRSTELTALIAAQESAGGDHDYLQALRTLRTSTALLLTNASSTLPRLTTQQVNVPTPAFVLAYERYGDSTRDSDILRENEIPHPGHCAGLLTVPAT